MKDWTYNNKTVPMTCMDVDTHSFEGEMDSVKFCRQYRLSGTKVGIYATVKDLSKTAKSNLNIGVRLRRWHNGQTKDKHP